MWITRNCYPFYLLLSEKGMVSYMYKVSLKTLLTAVTRTPVHQVNYILLYALTERSRLNLTENSKLSTFCMGRQPEMILLLHDLQATRNATHHSAFMKMEVIYGVFSNKERKSGIIYRAKKLFCR